MYESFMSAIQNYGIGHSVIDAVQLSHSNKTPCILRSVYIL